MANVISMNPKNMISESSRSANGFTLVELLVVIVIIITLAAMTRPNPKIPSSNIYNLSTASDPSQLLLMIDAEGFLNLSGPDDIASAIAPICKDTTSRHRQTANALFGDGHVSSYRLGEIAGSDSRKKAMRERWFTLR